jgi:hypothetical protein
MFLTKDEMERVQMVLGRTTEKFQTRGYCGEHLASETGIPQRKLEVLREFARKLPPTEYDIHTTGGTCDFGGHQVTGLVIKAKQPLLPTRQT